MWISSKTQVLDLNRHALDCEVSALHEQRLPAHEIFTLRCCAAGMITNPHLRWVFSSRGYRICSAIDLWSTSKAVGITYFPALCPLFWVIELSYHPQTWSENQPKLLMSAARWHRQPIYLRYIRHVRIEYSRTVHIWLISAQLSSAKLKLLALQFWATDGGSEHSFSHSGSCQLPSAGSLECDPWALQCTYTCLSA